MTRPHYEPYLGVVPTLLIDGKAVMTSMEDTPEMWTLMCHISRLLSQDVCPQCDHSLLTHARTGCRRDGCDCLRRGR